MTVLNDAFAYLRDGRDWSGDGGLLQLMTQQLLLTVTALMIAMAVGLPIALFLGHRGRGGFLAINISNVGRAIPTFALLAILVTADPWTDGIGLPGGGSLPLHLDHFPGTMSFGPYGRAGLATLVALTLFALPDHHPRLRRRARGAGRGRRRCDRHGISGRQSFLRVEVPLTVPVVASGLRLALVQVWATATIAALVAGPGLGRVIADGFFRSDYGKGLAGAVVVALVALVLECSLPLLQRLVEPVRRARSGSRPRSRRSNRPTMAYADARRHGRAGSRRLYRTRAAGPRDTEGPSCSSDASSPRPWPPAPACSPARAPGTTSRRTPSPARLTPPPRHQPATTAAGGGGPVRISGRASPRPSWSPRCTSSCSPMPATSRRQPRRHRATATCRAFPGRHRRRTGVRRRHRRLPQRPGERRRRPSRRRPATAAELIDAAQALLDKAGHRPARVVRGDRHQRVLRHRGLRHVQQTSTSSPTSKGVSVTLRRPPRLCRVGLDCAGGLGQPGYGIDITGGPAARLRQRPDLPVGDQRGVRAGRDQHHRRHPGVAGPRRARRRPGRSSRRRTSSRPSSASFLDAQSRRGRRLEPAHGGPDDREADRAERSRSASTASRSPTSPSTS